MRRRFTIRAVMLAFGAGVLAVALGGNATAPAPAPAAASLDAVRAAFAESAGPAWGATASQRAKPSRGWLATAARRDRGVRAILRTLRRADARLRRRGAALTGALRASGEEAAVLRRVAGAADALAADIKRLTKQVRRLRTRTPAARAARAATLAALRNGTDGLAAVAGYARGGSAVRLTVATTAFGRAGAHARVASRRLGCRRTCGVVL